MHSHSLDQWTHDHVFLGPRHAHNERRTWFVVALTAVMMVGEILAGTLFGSMALLADGWRPRHRQVGPGHRAAVISLISDDPLLPSPYKRRLGGLQASTT